MTSLVEVLDRACELPLHRLVGFAANLDFWTDEVRTALIAVDTYPERFSRIDRATRAWLSAHPPPELREERAERRGLHREPRTTPAVSNEQRMALGDTLVAAFRRFLDHCVRDGLIDPAARQRAEETAGTADRRV